MSLCKTIHETVSPAAVNLLSTHNLNGVLQNFYKSLLHLRTVYVSLTARRKLDDLFALFDNVTTACKFYNAIYIIFIIKLYTKYRIQHDN